MRDRLGYLSSNKPNESTLWGTVIQPYILPPSIFSIPTGIQSQSRMTLVPTARTGRAGAHTWARLLPPPLLPRPGVCSLDLCVAHKREGRQGLLKRIHYLDSFLRLNSLAPQVPWCFMDWKIGFHIQEKPRLLLNTAVLESGEKACSKQELFN